MMADVAGKRKANGLNLIYAEAVAIISAVALDGARAALCKVLEFRHGHEPKQALTTCYPDFSFTRNQAT